LACDRDLAGTCTILRAHLIPLIRSYSRQTAFTQPSYPLVTAVMGLNVVLGGRIDRNLNNARHLTLCTLSCFFGVAAAIRLLGRWPPNVWPV
jgi:hypothetical protein